MELKNETFIKVNGKNVESIRYPTGEIEVKLPALNYDAYHTPFEVTAQIFTSEDIMTLFHTLNTIKRVSNSLVHVLKLNYFPYARNDRAFTALGSDGLNLITGILKRNFPEFDTLTYDIHSIDAIEHSRIQSISKQTLIKNTKLEELIRHNNLTLAAPDSGSADEIKALAYRYYVPYIQMLKHRDSNGNITDFQLINKHPENNCPVNNILIIDDLCDGGATFIEAAKLLKEKGAKNLYLYVTHGLFNKGIEELKKHYKEIYCYFNYKNLDGVINVQKSTSSD